MIEIIKDYTGTLTEELKYYDNAISYTKSLEATLWGLEQQAQYPENSSKVDQQDMAEEINKIRVKLASLKKLLRDHEKKILLIITSFTDKVSESSSCGGCER